MELGAVARLCILVLILIFADGNDDCDSVEHGGNCERDDYGCQLGF